MGRRQRVFLKIEDHFVVLFIPFTNLMRSIWLFACVMGPKKKRKLKCMPEPPQVAAAHPHVLSIIIDPHPDPLPAPCLSSRRQPLELASRCAPLPVITRFDNFHGRLPPCPPITISRPILSPGPENSFFFSYSNSGCGWASLNFIWIYTRIGFSFEPQISVYQNSGHAWPVRLSFRSLANVSILLG